MTRDPIAVYDKGSRNEALNIMVSRKFRHLPVITEDTDNTTSVAGLLDITKCVFERLDDLEVRVNDDQSIISAMDVLERRGAVGAEHAVEIRKKHGCPDIAYVLSKMSGSTDILPEVNSKATVREAARVMKKSHSTAVLVTGNAEANEILAGIFTTKDIVLRVIAASLDSSITSVNRVMTPHPDYVRTSNTILEALKKLYTGRYLHLPVMEDKFPVGLVDVMTLTVTMLQYLIAKESTQTDDGNVGNKYLYLIKLLEFGVRFKSG
jgi:CBS domain-containing protein